MATGGKIERFMQVSRAENRQPAVVIVRLVMSVTSLSILDPPARLPIMTSQRSGGERLPPSAVGTCEPGQALTGAALSIVFQVHLGSPFAPRTARGVREGRGERGRLMETFLPIPCSPRPSIAFTLTSCL